MSYKDTAREKLTKEAKDMKDGMAEIVAQQVAGMIKSEADAKKVLAEDKPLSQLKKEFDDFAGKKKKGSQSVITPVESEKLIKEYYGFSEETAAAVESEVIDITAFL